MTPPYKFDTLALHAGAVPDETGSRAVVSFPNLRATYGIFLIGKESA